MQAPPTTHDAQMSEHEIKTCPRCEATFECKPNDPVHCRCASADLAEDRLFALANHDAVCLCLACLREVGAGSPPTGRGPR